jgi:hypothetical protein
VPAEVNGTGDILFTVVIDIGEEHYETEGKLKHETNFPLQISWHYHFHMPYWKWVSLQESDPRKKWVQPAKLFELQKQYTPLEDIYNIIRTFVKFTSAYNIDAVHSASASKEARKYINKKAKKYVFCLFSFFIFLFVALYRPSRRYSTVHW